jgi:hypothetical protein
VTLSIFKQKHFTDDLHVFVTLEDLSPRWTRCPSRATKVVVSLINLCYPLLRGDLIVKTELDIGNHSMRFKVERDSILCGHLNGDVGNLRG